MARRVKFPFVVLLLVTPPTVVTIGQPWYTFPTRFLSGNDVVGGVIAQSLTVDGGR